MEPFDPNRSRSRSRSRNRKPTISSTERFLGVPSHAPPHENPTSSSSSEELDEDDVVFFSDDYTEPNNPSSTTSSSSSSTPNHHHHKGFGFGPPDSFGILAALPDKAPNGNNFFHKASVSVSVSLSSSSSSSRSIPTLPKPPPLLHDRTPSSSSVKWHQSAPVNVPILSPAMMKARIGRNDDDGDDDDAAEEEEMVPPHEMVARNSPMLSCSVLEGMGRTLKGRDLRRVRNAVWHQTGFLD